MFDPWNRWMLIIHVVVTLHMTGVIWIVQLVHYPLMNRVSGERFAEFSRDHQASIFWVVGPAMLVEMLTAVGLLLHPPERLPVGLLWLGLALIILIWLSTIFIQIPLHQRLERAWNPDAHRTLVLSNWLRTVAWTARAALVAYFLERTLSS